MAGTRRLGQNAQAFVLPQNSQTDGLEAPSGSPQDPGIEKLKKLFGSMVNGMLRDSKGALDLTKISATNFAEFQTFLQDQAGLNDGVIFRNPYENLLKQAKYQPLLKALYEAKGPVDADLLQAFQADLVSIDADKFVQSNFGSTEGRWELRLLLRDSAHFNKDLRSDLTKAVARAGEREKLAVGYQVDAVTDQISLWNYFNWFVTDEELNQATLAAEDILSSADYIHARADKIRAKEEKLPENIGLLSEEFAGRKLDETDVARFREIAKNSHNHPLTQAHSHLAQLWLLAANNSQWASEELRPDHAGRGHILKETERLLEKSKAVKNDADFQQFNKELQDFLHGALPGWGILGDTSSSPSPQLDWIEHKAVGKGLTELFDGMPSHLRGPYDSILQLSDQWKHAIDMGERIWVPSPQPSAKPKPVAVLDLPPATQTIDVQDAAPDESQKAVHDLIQGLQKTKQELWYGYKQHKAISRIGSNIAQVFGAGDITDIQKANRQIDQIIERLQKADSKEAVEKEIQQLFQSLKKDCALYKAFAAAEMDGTEQLLGLVQTVAVTIGIGMATKGMGWVVEADAVLLRAAMSARGLRMAQGFAMGATISTVENALALAGGEVRQGPESVAKWFKDAMATGFSMTLTAATLMSASTHKTLVQNLLARYAVGGAQAVRHFLADTGLESIEELIDQYTRQVLDGKSQALTWGEIRQIVSICVAGGGTRWSAVAEAIRGQQTKIRSSDLPSQPGPPSTLIQEPATAFGPKRAQRNLSLLKSPLLAPMWMMMGAGGIGGGGKKFDRVAHLGKWLSKLENLHQSLRSLEASPTFKLRALLRFEKRVSDLYAYLRTIPNQADRETATQEIQELEALAKSRVLPRINFDMMLEMARIHRERIPELYPETLHLLRILSLEHADPEIRTWATAILGSSTVSEEIAERRLQTQIRQRPSNLDSMKNIPAKSDTIPSPEILKEERFTERDPQDLTPLLEEPGVPRIYKAFDDAFADKNIDRAKWLLFFVLRRITEDSNQFHPAVQSLIRYPDPSVRLAFYQVIDELAQDPGNHEFYRQLSSTLWTNESDFIAQDLVSEDPWRSDLAKRMSEFFEGRKESEEGPPSPPSSFNSFALLSAGITPLFTENSHDTLLGVTFSLLQLLTSLDADSLISWAASGWKSWQQTGIRPPTSPAIHSHKNLDLLHNPLLSPLWMMMGAGGIGGGGKSKKVQGTPQITWREEIQGLKENIHALEKARMLRLGALFRFENRMDELSANIRELPEKKREIATEELKALQELKNSRILPRITLPMVKEIAEICRTGDNEDYSEYFPISLNLLHDLSEGHPDAEVRRLATSTLQKKLSETGDVDWDLDSNDEMEFAEPSYEQRLQTFQDSLETLKTSPLDIPALRRLQMQRMLLERYLEGLSKREKANAVKKLDELDRRTVSEVFSWIDYKMTQEILTNDLERNSRLSPEVEFLMFQLSEGHPVAEIRDFARTIIDLDPAEQYEFITEGSDLRQFDELLHEPGIPRIFQSLDQAFAATDLVKVELLLTFVLERLKEAPNRFPSAVQSLIRYPHPSVRLMLYNAIDALAQRPDTHERYQPLFSALWTNESDFIAQDLVSENRLRSELAKKIAEFFAEFIEKRGRSQKVPGSPPSESN